MFIARGLYGKKRCTAQVPSQILCIPLPNLDTCGLICRRACAEVVKRRRNMSEGLLTHVSPGQMCGLSSGLAAAA